MFLEKLRRQCPGVEVLRVIVSPCTKFQDQILTPSDLSVFRYSICTLPQESLKVNEQLFIKLSDSW